MLRRCSRAASATALRKIGRLTSLSKSQVSVMAAELVTQFRTRTLDAGP